MTWHGTAVLLGLGGCVCELRLDPGDISVRGQHVEDLRGEGRGEERRESGRGRRYGGTRGRRTRLVRRITAITSKQSNTVVKG